MCAVEFGAATLACRAGSRADLLQCQWWPYGIDLSGRRVTHYGGYGRRQGSGPVSAGTGLRDRRLACLHCMGIVARATRLPR